MLHTTSYLTHQALKPNRLDEFEAPKFATARQDVEILQLRAKAEIPVMSNLRLIWITNSIDHSSVWVGFEQDTIGIYSEPLAENCKQNMEQLQILLPWRIYIVLLNIFFKAKFSQEIIYVQYYLDWLSELRNSEKWIYGYLSNFSLGR